MMEKCNSFAVKVAAKIEENKFKAYVKILSELVEQIKEDKTDLEGSLLSSNAVQGSEQMTAGINAYKFVQDTKIRKLIEEYELKIIYYSEMGRTGDFKETHEAKVHGETKIVSTPLSEYGRVLDIINKNPGFVKEDNLEKILGFFFFQLDY